MIKARENGLLLTVEQQATIFGPEWQSDWLGRARRQGDTQQWAEYAEQRIARLTIGGRSSKSIPN